MLTMNDEGTADVEEKSDATNNKYLYGIIYWFDMNKSLNRLEEYRKCESK
jgi:hypothetical protein